MFVDVNLPHTVRFVPERGRKAVTQTVYSPCRLRVNAPSTDEAPIAFRWRYTDDADVSGEIRWSGDRCWKKIKTSRYLSRGLTLGIDALSHFKGALGVDNPLRKAVEKIVHNDSPYFHKRLFDPNEVRTVERNDFDHYVARAQEVLDQDFILIDGEFWEPCAEPRLVLDVTDIGYALRNGVPEGLGFKVAESGFGSSVFRMDRLEEACASFAIDVDDAGVEVDVLIDEAVRFEDDRFCLMSAASRIFAKGQEDFVHWDRDKASAFFDFRDAYLPFFGSLGHEVAESAPSGEELEAILETATDFLRHLEEDEFQEQCFELERWRNRPFDFGVAGPHVR